MGRVFEAHHRNAQENRGPGRLGPPYKNANVPFKPSKIAEFAQFMWSVGQMEMAELWNFDKLCSLCLRLASSRPQGRCKHSTLS